MNFLEQPINFCDIALFSCSLVVIVFLLQCMLWNLKHEIEIEALYSPY